MNEHSNKVIWLIAGCFVSGIGQAQVPTVSGESGASFGVTVVAPFGFCGRIYEMPEGRAAPRPIPPIRPDAPRGRPSVPAPQAPALEPNVVCTTRLPRFDELQSVGSIYTTKLNVPTRDFQSGFPGVTGRFEWFAIDYTARFWIEKPGKYSFMLLSDDGSALYIDERRIVDNDCMHPPLSQSGSVRLDGGVHDMRVGYFQGPRYQVALILYVKPPGEKWKVFDTGDFKPPTNPADWHYPNLANLDVPVDPCQVAKHPRKLITRP